ncbi:MAG: zf-HC2 domain-containing protein [candidate division Zixibacteria bacterium]|nr:zf-HC2 domain-containing protein [candidate division Zixibacteria bacterium]
MKNGKSKYEEKLSAYLDGQLTPEEMAEIAAALDTNPGLANQLEQMRRLGELAESSLPEFDDAILAKLEQNIMGNLENSGEESSTVFTSKLSERKIIPIWQKYIAVAASVAVLFLAGRLAWKDIDSPQSSIMHSPAPSMMQMPLSAPEETNDLESGYIEDESLGGDSYLIEKSVQSDDADKGVSFNTQSIARPTVDVESDELNVPEKQKVATPSRRSEGSKKIELKNSASATGIEGNEAVVGIAKKAEDDNVFSAFGEIYIADQPAEKITAEPVVLSEENTETVALNEASDSYDSEAPSQGESGLSDMNPSMSNVVHSGTYDKILADSIVSVRHKLKADMEFRGDAQTTIEMADIQELSLLPLDSLKDIYALYVIPSKNDRKEYLLSKSVYTEIIGDTISNPMALLDSLAQLPGIDNDANEIESLYLRAKTHYQLYLMTDEREHYREALDARQQLEDVLIDQMNLHPRDTRLAEYAKDILQWRFTE